MIWGRSNRFSSQPSSANAGSDYLSSLTEKEKQRLMDTNPNYSKNYDFSLTEGEARVMGKANSPYKASMSIISPSKKRKVVPFYREPGPGPGSYHNPATLIKPSFNKAKMTPEQYMQASTLDPHIKNIKDGSFSPDNSQSRTSLDYKLYRTRSAPPARTSSSALPGAGAGGGGAAASGTPGPSLSPLLDGLKRGGQSPSMGSPNKHGSYGFSPSRASSAGAGSHGNPLLYHQRYPPQSDSQMKKWTSISRGSYSGRR